MPKRRHRRRHHSHTFSDFKSLHTSVTPRVRLWMLRILVPLGGWEDALYSIKCDGDFSRTSQDTDHTIRALGLGELVDSRDDIRVEDFAADMRTYHREAEKEAHKSDKEADSSALRRNMRKLARLAGLSDTDCRILEFAILLHDVKPLKEATEILEELSTPEVPEVLSRILDIPLSAARASLSPKSILNRSGLLSLSEDSNELPHKLDLLSHAFPSQMLVPDMDPVNLLRDMVSPGVAPELAMDDYEYLASSLAVLRPYLRRAAEKRRPGVNVFLYGPPGTGKTQLARVLAAELGRDLFEVSNTDEDDDPVSGDLRLRAFRAAQSFFAKRKALILFDEAEDVFPDKRSGLLDALFGGGRGRATDKCKGWINRMLEENPLPTLWISNSIAGLDPAYARRFDGIIELPVPPKPVRERIIRNACGELLDSREVARVAESKALAPAVVTRATGIVDLIRDELDEGEISPAFELLINNVLEAQGHRPIKRNDPNRLPEIYDPAFINADQDLAPIVKALVRGRAGRLCLYGPPGTGKTAYGRWVAERMGVPLLVKKASDLLSMWVGQSEKNIAAAFKEAECEGAVLLIDEMDSFLQDRRSAKRSWEITQVNEMLTQIESFSGVFIASTNLMDNLDQASLRRFDLKLKFDFMRPEQAWKLLQKHCAALDITAPAKPLKLRLARLLNLTPGDFAAVVRQRMMRPTTTAEGLVEALETECALKEGVKRHIGFAQ